MSRLKHPNISPFYEWLDHDEIRELVHRTLNMPPGERLVLMKALVPGLVEAMGVEELEDVLDELAVKARRYDEARSHPGEGRRQRRTPGEPIGGATPEGHVYASEARDPDRPGGRNAERELERSMWREARVRERHGRSRAVAGSALAGIAAIAVVGAVALLTGKARTGRRGHTGERGRRRGREARGTNRPVGGKRSAPGARMGSRRTDTELADRYDRYAG